MTALIPTVIDLDGFGGGSTSPATLVGGSTPWDTDDGDTAYISMVPSPANSSYFTFQIPPGLPLAWFYDPVFDISARYAGSTAPAYFLVSTPVQVYPGAAFSQVSITLTSTYATTRHHGPSLISDEAAFWAAYIGGTPLLMDVNTATLDGIVGIPNPGLASVRITYFACWVDDIIPPRIPLRGRQRDSGVSGPTPMRGRNNAPYGLRGRQESNR